MHGAQANPKAYGAARGWLGGIGATCVSGDPDTTNPGRTFSLKRTGCELYGLAQLSLGAGQDSHKEEWRVVATDKKVHAWVTAR